jgi:hypothetical protein
LLRSQAAVLSYVATYWLLLMYSALISANLLLLKKNEPGKDRNASVHEDTWFSIMPVETTSITQKTMHR